jgi:DNA-binding GntR family transcriptional regulator
MRHEPERPMTAVAFIVNALRDDILVGRIPGGSPLLLDAIAERFGTSVIPIREALRVLDSEGLVMLRPHRTALVAQLSFPELQDIFRVRLILDTEAVRWAHGNLSAEALAGLHGLVDEMGRHASRGREKQVLDLHAQVHFGIYRASGSPVLVGLLESLWAETARYRYANKRKRDYNEAWIQEHRHLLDLLERNDSDSAALEMRAHVTRTVTLYQTSMGATVSEDGKSHQLGHSTAATLIRE